MFTLPPRLVVMAPAAANLPGRPSTDLGRRLVPGGVPVVLQGRPKWQAGRDAVNLHRSHNRRSREPARLHPEAHGEAVRVKSLTPGLLPRPHCDVEMDELPRTAGARRSCRPFLLFRIRVPARPFRPAAVGLARGGGVNLHLTSRASPLQAVPRTRTIGSRKLPHLLPHFPIKSMMIGDRSEARGLGLVAFAASGAADRAMRRGSLRDPRRGARPAPRSSPLTPLVRAPPVRDAACRGRASDRGLGVWRSQI